MEPKARQASESDDDGVHGDSEPEADDEKGTESDTSSEEDCCFRQIVFESFETSILYKSWPFETI